MAGLGTVSLTGHEVCSTMKVESNIPVIVATQSQFMKPLSISASGSLSEGTTIAALVSNLSTLVGNSTANRGAVTAFITSRPSIAISTVSNIGHITKPLVVTQNSQPLLLPKPSVQQKQNVQCTPTKFAYPPNPSVLTSPLHMSPGFSWQGTSPLQNRKRPHDELDNDQFDSKRRRTPNRCGGEKGGKGLRHFSMKVCEKVQKKGVTSYNEVADELVQEFSEQTSRNLLSNIDQTYDQKNIRRRVYDALNVLMAMNIISKEKKEIKWVGLPTNSAQECKHLEDQKRERIERIKQKQQQLKELIVQQIAFKNLVERNKRLEKTNGPPQPNACIHLPFIIVNTSKKTTIDCSISSDKSEYLFNFNEAFEIRDDIEVLKRMGLSFGLDKGECSEKNLNTAKSMVPKAIAPYVNQMANGSYGNMTLIDTFRAGLKSPLATPIASIKESPGPSTRKSNRSRRSTSSSASVNNKTVTKIAYTSSPSATSEYDSDNDGDDEHSTLME